MDYKRNECEQLRKTEASYTDPVVTYREAEKMFNEAKDKFREAKELFNEAYTSYKCAFILFVSTAGLVLIQVLLLYTRLKH